MTPAQEEQIGKLMALQARQDSLAMTRKWGSHQPSYAQEESENGRKNFIKRLITVRILHLQGKSLSEIASEIRSDRSTASKLVKYGREKLPSKMHLLQVLYMLEERHKPATIANEFNVTRQSVGNIRRRYWEPLKK